MTAKDVGAWVDHLLHDKGLSPKSVRGKYLAAVSSIYALGVSRGVIEDNPAKDIRVAVPKAQKTRERGYSDTEAAAILKAALGDPASLGRMAEWNKKAIRWVPWLCAYTGARVSEITQLHKRDFEDVQGVLSIRITSEREDGKSTKTGNYRRVPLHSHLLEAGIVEFVRDASPGPLFFEDPKNKEERLGRARSAGDKVRKWVKGTVRLTDKRIQPNHAWRHRFKTLCYNAGIETRYADAIQGHEDGSAASSYGDIEVLALKREIEKIPRQIDF
ncbi:tyrosine-type recombinase/integrase [Celeribacter sp.]|uniref:tyrosine-type recombinase/integrase n=1 Tax=Celeribacter sp. TaxID=1890673 RepID=UPI003A8FE584